MINSKRISVSISNKIYLYTTKNKDKYLNLKGLIEGNGMRKIMYMKKELSEDEAMDYV